MSSNTAISFYKSVFLCINHSSSILINAPPATIAIIVSGLHIGKKKIATATLIACIAVDIDLVHSLLATTINTIAVAMRADIVVKSIIHFSL
jgi:hypothetical protein